VTCWVTCAPHPRHPSTHRRHHVRRPRPQVHVREPSDEPVVFLQCGVAHPVVVKHLRTQVRLPTVRLNGKSAVTLWRKSQELSRVGEVDPAARLGQCKWSLQVRVGQPGVQQQEPGEGLERRLAAQVDRGKCTPSVADPWRARRQRSYPLGDLGDRDQLLSRGRLQQTGGNDSVRAPCAVDQGAQGCRHRDPVDVAEVSRGHRRAHDAHPGWSYRVPVCRHDDDDPRHGRSARDGLQPGRRLAASGSSRACRDDEFAHAQCPDLVGVDLRNDELTAPAALQRTLRHGDVDGIPGHAQVSQLTGRDEATLRPGGFHHARIEIHDVNDEARQGGSGGWAGDLWTVISAGVPDS